MSALRFLLSDPLRLVCAYLALLSAALFFVMGADKRRARLGRFRVSEKTLFLLAIFGGACGGWLGMRLFRHKTRHRAFALGFPLLSLVQLGALLYFFFRRFL